MSSVESGSYMHARKQRAREKWEKVYIILLNYNGWEDTIECLESVLKNDYKNYQIIIVDNNSPNNSMDYIINWAEGKQDVVYNENSKLKHLSQPFEPKPIHYVLYAEEEAIKGGDREKEAKYKNPLIFIKASKNDGFSVGNNIGIKYALEKNDFEYICLLNNDTVVESNFLSELSDTIKLDKNIGIAGGKILNYYEPGKIWYEGGKLDLFRGSGYNSREGQLDDGDKSTKKVSFVTGCLLLIRKEVFYKVGLLREEYFLYVEDPDFCYRCLKNGFYLYVNLTSKIYHKISASIKGKSEMSSPLEVYYNTRNRLCFILKIQDKKINKIIFLGFFIPTRIIKGIKWYFKGSKDLPKALVRGFIDFFKGHMGQL